jgi:hypothetical protein
MNRKSVKRRLLGPQLSVKCSSGVTEPLLERTETDEDEEDVGEARKEQQEELQRLRDSFVRAYARVARQRLCLFFLCRTTSRTETRA